MGWYGFDLYYLILVVPAIVFAMIASANVNRTFRKFSEIRTKRGITGAQAAEMVLHQNGVSGVTIEPVGGNLTDHFDPRKNVIRLSESVYHSPSVSAVGVAAHEAGHAVQYAQGYTPVRIRTAILPVCQFGSTAAWPLVLVGLLFNNNTFFALGLLFFLVATLFQVATLPVEFNASTRAMVALEQGHLLADDELKYARKTLSAAAMTYVAALAVSLAQLLRLVLLFSGRRRD